ncbi:MAG TPA: hypothetical protein VMV43_03775 [Candidatus Nanopelagicaceae bacterium]|nr:hypothetical protein [Candidatus Nanopelagicaceae bacterium]
MKADNSLSKIQKLLCVLLILTPLAHITLLILLYFHNGVSSVPDFPLSPEMLSLLFILASIAITIGLYLIALPKVEKRKQEENYFILCAMSIATGSTSVSLFGFFIAFFGLLFQGQVQWWAVGLLTALGICNGVIFYKKVLEPL